MKQSEAVQRAVNRRVKQSRAPVPDGLGLWGPFIALSALALGACADMGGEGQGRNPIINVPVTTDSGIMTDAAVPNVMGPDAGMSPPRGQCGDGKVQPGEVCDDGNRESDDGCASDCRSREEGFDCRVPGQPCVSTVQCGDGRLGGDEECDDGNARSGDGCSDECELEPGAICPTVGARCGAVRCGDGIIAGAEQCDDGDEPRSGDGCDEHCQLEPGYACAPGEACVLTVCNDGKVEGSEPCDDGNMIVGDGCTPFCELEPDCSEGACKSRCGDGLILPADDEECDDRNTVAGDGCSPDCKIEEGHTCTLETGELPDVLSVPVTYRDFNAMPTAGNGRHPDFQIFTGPDVTPGLVKAELGADGKPVYAGVCDMASTAGCGGHMQQLTNKSGFDQWYRDTPDVNVTKVERMELQRVGDTNAYAIENSAFFPWDGDMRSLVALGEEELHEGHNFGFTSEVRYYFEFSLDPDAPQTLTFSGDDDVWVFINHKLAVDIGGLHPEVMRSITLDRATADELGLEVGQIYEIALFHAERHTSHSNFNLTLQGFVSRKSSCVPDCGDGKVAGKEECDDGENLGGYGGCTSECKLGPRCGDAIVQKDEGETCDDGNLVDTDGCSSQCELKGPG